METDTPTNLTYEQWVEKYLPLGNPLDPDMAYDGKCFENAGYDLEFINKAYACRPDTIWTMWDGDDRLKIQAGMHTGAVMGYFITVVPWEHEQIFVPGL